MMKEFGESESEGRKESAVREPREEEEERGTIYHRNYRTVAMRNKDKEQKEHIKGNPRCYIDGTRRRRQTALKK